MVNRPCCFINACPIHMGGICTTIPCISLPISHITNIYQCVKTNRKLAKQTLRHILTATRSVVRFLSISSALKINCLKNIKRLICNRKRVVHINERTKINRKLKQVWGQTEIGNFWRKNPSKIYQVGLLSIKYLG